MEDTNEKRVKKISRRIDKEQKNIKKENKDIKYEKLEQKIKEFEKDPNIKLVIRTKYNFILKFFNELNINITFLIIFLCIIAVTGENKTLGVIIFVLMLMFFVFKAIYGYKSFKYTVYLLYKNKIKKVNLYNKREKTLYYEDLKDIRFGNLNNGFGEELFGLENIIFKSKKRNLIFSKDIMIENVSKKDELIEKVVQSIDRKYTERILREKRR